MFQLVRRSDLPGPANNVHGRGAAEPRVHLNAKHGVLSFSKHAAEVFGRRLQALVEYDKDTERIRVNAIDELPPKVEIKHCFRMHYKQKTVHDCSFSVARLLRGLGLKGVVTTGTCEILDMSKERHSIILRFPKVESPEAPEPAGQPLAAAAAGPWQVDDHLEN